MVDLGVLGQSLVGLGHGGGQLFVGAVRAMGPEQRMVVRHGLAIDEGLGDRPALGQFGFHPLGVYVASETGDELMFLASLEVEKTLGVELAEIAAGPPLGGVRRLSQIAQQG
ncbi:hypothetical protein D3C86_1845300 [compost metagenome]